MLLGCRVAGAAMVGVCPAIKPWRSYRGKTLPRALHQVGSVHGWEEGLGWSYREIGSRIPKRMCGHVGKMVGILGTCCVQRYSCLSLLNCYALVLTVIR